MQKWEYLKASISRKWNSGLIHAGWSDWTRDVDLNMLGEAGWELISEYPIASVQGEHWAGMTTEIIFTFKRPKSG